MHVCVCFFPPQKTELSIWHQHVNMSLYPVLGFLIVIFLNVHVF
jgi:hypothetical protein